MKNRLWLLQLPILAVFVACFVLTQRGIDGQIENEWLRETAYPWVRRVSTMATDIKFRARGQVPKKNNVVVIEIDNQSIDAIGRWPWHRDVTAKLIEKSFEAGAKVVGLDIVFSEPDPRVPPEIGEMLAKNGLGDVAAKFETDPVLSNTIAKYSDRLVLGWASEAKCQPRFGGIGRCPLLHPDTFSTWPRSVEKFSIADQRAGPKGFDPLETPIISMVTMLANLDEYNLLGEHAGFFSAEIDADGYVRRNNVLYLGQGRAYPSMPLEMARVGLGENLRLTFAADNTIDRLEFAKSGRPIHVTPQGVMDANFRGKQSETFPYISALDILSEGDEIQGSFMDRRLASSSKGSLLRDAYVLIGVTALGAFDMRHFPFEQSVPGVDAHAQMLDNLLSGDELRVRGGPWGSDGYWAIVLMMTLAALAFAFAMQKLEAVPALLLAVASFALIGFVDVKILFSNLYNWDTGFLYIEMATIFVLTIAAKYVAEERNKKFIRGAFSKYVAPAVVDSIMKDPESLSLGGQKKDLTILFSDIRSFTTMSEQLDAKQLASFLNEYLSIMTNIVFEHEGTLDKYIGDAVMAFWGAPLDQAKHAQSSCRSAIAMMKALKVAQPRFKTQYGLDVDIGIGINTGLVNVGNMGSENNFEYTVIGDHVNLASRLEGLTKYYGAAIISSRFTIQSIEEAIGGRKQTGAIETQPSAPKSEGVEAKGTYSESKPGRLALVPEAVPPYRTLDFVKVKGKKTAVELVQILHEDYPADALALFEEGRQLYSKREWDAAEAKLASASERIRETLGAADAPSLLLIERCQEFRRNPPAPDWDGSWEMTSK